MSALKCKDEAENKTWKKKNLKHKTFTWPASLEYFPGEHAVQSDPPANQPWSLNRLLRCWRGIKEIRLLFNLWARQHLGEKIAPALCSRIFLVEKETNTWDKVCFRSLLKGWVCFFAFCFLKENEYPPCKAPVLVEYVPTEHIVHRDTPINNMAGDVRTKRSKWERN